VRERWPALCLLAGLSFGSIALLWYALIAEPVPGVALWPAAGVVFAWVGLTAVRFASEWRAERRAQQAWRHAQQATVERRFPRAAP
jgi:membrane protein implicated in regulation of membrane protease activity